MTRARGWPEPTRQMGVLDPQVWSALPRSGGRPVPSGLLPPSAIIGHDIGDVLVHDSADTHTVARRLHARAFTVGRQIYLGEKAPWQGSLAGQRLLRHEVDHAMNARPGAAPGHRVPPFAPAREEQRADASGAARATTSTTWASGGDTVGRDLLSAQTTASEVEVRLAGGPGIADPGQDALDYLGTLNLTDLVDTAVVLDSRGSLEQVAGHLRIGEHSPVAGALLMTVYLSQRRRATPSWGIAAAQAVAALPASTRDDLLTKVLTAMGRGAEVPQILEGLSAIQESETFRASEGEEVVDDGAPPQTMAGVAPGPNRAVSGLVQRAGSATALVSRTPDLTIRTPGRRTWMRGKRLPPYPKHGLSVKAALRSSHPGLLHALTDEQLRVWQRAVDLNACYQTHQKYVAALIAYYKRRSGDAYWIVSEYVQERERLDRYLPRERLPNHITISAKDLLSEDIQDPPAWDRVAEMGFRQWAVKEISERQINIPIQPDEKSVGALVPGFFARAPFHTKGVITAEDLKRHFKTEYDSRVAFRPELGQLARELQQLRDAQWKVHKDHKWRSERNAEQPIVRRIAKLTGSGGHDYPLQTMWKRPEELAARAESALKRRQLELALPMIADSVQETKVAIKRFTDYEKEVTSGAARAIGVLEGAKWLGTIAAGFASGGLGLSASALVTGGYVATQDVAQQASGVAFGTQQGIDVQQTINQAGTAVAMALIGGKLQSGFKPAVKLRLDSLPSLSVGAKEFLASVIASGTSSIYTTATQTALDHVVNGKALPKSAEEFADLILKEAIKSIALDVGTFHINAKLAAEFQAWRSGRSAPIEVPGEPIAGTTGQARPSVPAGALNKTAIRRLLTQSGGWTRLHAELTSGTGLGQGLTPTERTRLVNQFEVHRQTLATDVAKMYDGQVTSSPGTPGVQVRFTGDDAATRAAQAEAFLDTKEPGWRTSNVAVEPRPASSKAAVGEHTDLRLTDSMRDPGRHADIVKRGRATRSASGGKITLFHGTGGQGLRGIGGLGRGRIVVTQSGGAHQDLGRGFYLTTDRGVATEYARRAATKTSEKSQKVVAQHVVAWEVPVDKLGVVVDIRPGGNFAAQWEAFLQRPFAGGRIKGMPSYREAITKLADNRGTYFDEFLSSIRHGHADTIIAPVGSAPFSGTGVGTQVCLRTQRAADVLNRMMRALRH